MFLTVNGLRLFYEKTGEGPPILLLHGNGESHEIFRTTAAQLAARYTVYALDSRDHGGSDRTRELSYALMSEDTARFIQDLNLDRPVLVGFSDGGIIGLTVAFRYPALLSRLVVCGANTTPEAMNGGWLLLFKLISLFTRNRKLSLVLTEPNITAEQLGRIQIPVLVLAGENDMIREEDTRFIAASIPGAVLSILKNENHMSYVVNSPKLYSAMAAFLDNG